MCAERSQIMCQLAKVKNKCLQVASKEMIHQKVLFWCNCISEINFTCLYAFKHPQTRKKEKKEKEWDLQATL